MTTGQLRGAASLEKGLELFQSLIADGGATPLSALARRAAIPPSTAQRIAAAFVRQGLLSRVARGRYVAGVRLARLAQTKDVNAVLIAAGRPLVRALSRDIRTTTHLGVLEGDMVTYLVKEHGGGLPVLTRELIQLEAYCSGIGKVLLAHLDPVRQDAYLAAGPFVALTARTTTDPRTLRALLRRIRRQGYAVDNAELEDDLYCLAVPVVGAGGEVVAAVSASFRSAEPVDLAVLEPLRRCATRIGRRLGAPRDVPIRRTV